MVRFTVDNRNRLIFYGNPVGYVKADTAVVDEMFRTDELNQYLSRPVGRTGSLTVSYPAR